MIGDLETLLRKIVRDELARILGVEPDSVADDDAELRARAAERAARLRAARGGGK